MFVRHIERAAEGRSKDVPTREWPIEHSLKIPLPIVRLRMALCCRLINMLL